MIDMTQTIIPKSDQLNADDLLAGRTMTITITNVSKGNAEQPIAISFEGDNGKPYKPGKSMRRVMVQIWGKDASQYAGRSMTLYCDPEVKFGGQTVGGIRISHMSGIDQPVTMALTATKGSRRPFTVKPLQNAPAGRTAQAATPSAPAGPPSDAKKKALRVETAINASDNADDLDALWEVDFKPEISALEKESPRFFAMLKAQYDDKMASFTTTTGDDIGP